MHSNDVIAILAGATALVAAIATAAVQIIGALRGVSSKLQDHEARSEGRFKATQADLAVAVQRSAAGPPTVKLSRAGTPADTGPGRL